MINLDRIGKAKADLLSAERQIRALLADGKEAYRTDAKGPPALKYLLVVAVEAITDVCQHVLAKAKQVPCDGYVDCIMKAGTEGIIDARLANRLRRLADLRNSLVHRYWIIEDDRLFDETRENVGDLSEFLSEVDAFVGALPKR